MSEYQAVYDAVRSRISNGDIGSAIESAMSLANVGHYFHMAQLSIEAAAGEHERPSVLFRPRLYKGAGRWYASYDDGPNEGVTGAGNSPDEAMRDFDKIWNTKTGDT